MAAVAIALGVTAWSAETAPQVSGTRAAEARLLEAARQGDLLAVKAAVAEGARLDCRSTDGLTPLLETVSRVVGKPLDNQRRDCLAFLLEQGADVNAKDPDKRTALIHATRAGDLDTVRLLVQARAFIVDRDRFHKTALLYAAEGHREILKYLGDTLKAQRGVAW